MEESLAKAQRWADKIWKKAENSWLERKQDLNYRKYVSRPAMEKAIRSVPIIKRGLFFDVGCGNGIETIYLAEMLLKNGHYGRLIGIDRNNFFIRNIKKGFKVGKKIEISFQAMSVAELVKKGNNQADLVLSVFLLQDLPNAEIFFQAVDAILKKKGFGIFLLLHPFFASNKKAKGILSPEQKLKARYWRWAAQYPIVEEDGKTFYVPYFHRTIGDYQKIAGEYFKTVSLIDVLPSSQAIAESERKKASPLYTHPGNLYYPEIVKIPSSLIIKIQK